jgi:hypothetical protein
MKISGFTNDNEFDWLPGSKINHKAQKLDSGKMVWHIKGKPA